MAFAQHTYDPIQHRGWNPIIVYLATWWDEQASSELGYLTEYELEFSTIEEALQAVNRINTRSYDLEYAWRQDLRTRRIVPTSLEIAIHPRDRAVKVVYLKLGNDIYFTGVDAIKGLTVNREESCIEAIELAVRLPWQQFTFYDIERGRDDNTFIVDRLELEKSGLHVAGWHPVAISLFHYQKGYVDQQKLSGIPPEVLEAFYDFLYFQPGKLGFKPEWWGAKLFLEELLDEWDRQFVSLQEATQRSQKPAADILRDRLIMALSENSGYITDEIQKDIYRVVSAAFSVIALWHFSERQRRVYLHMFSNGWGGGTDEFRQQGFIPLTEEQANVLARVAARAGISFDPNQRQISLAPIEEELKKNPAVD